MRGCELLVLGVFTGSWAHTLSPPGPMTSDPTKCPFLLQRRFSPRGGTPRSQDSDPLMVPKPLRETGWGRPALKGWGPTLTGGPQGARPLPIPVESPRRGASHPPRVAKPGWFPAVPPLGLTLIDKMVREKPAEQTGGNRHQPGHHVEDPTLQGGGRPQRGQFAQAQWLPKAADAQEGSPRPQAGFPGSGAYLALTVPHPG